MGRSIFRTGNILRKECPNDSKFGPILCRNELAIQWCSLIWRNAHCQFYKNPQVLGGHKTEEEKSTKESDGRMAGSFDITRRMMTLFTVAERATFVLRINNGRAMCGSFGCSLRC